MKPRVGFRSHPACGIVPVDGIVGSIPTAGLPSLKKWNCEMAKQFWVSYLFWLRSEYNRIDTEQLPSEISIPDLDDIEFSVRGFLPGCMAGLMAGATVGGMETDSDVCYFPSDLNNRVG